MRDSGLTSSMSLRRAGALACGRCVALRRNSTVSIGAGTRLVQVVMRQPANAQVAHNGRSARRMSMLLERSDGGGVGCRGADGADGAAGADARSGGRLGGWRYVLQRDGTSTGSSTSCSEHRGRKCSRWPGHPNWLDASGPDVCNSTAFPDPAYPTVVASSEDKVLGVLRYTTAPETDRAGWDMVRLIVRVFGPWGATRRARRFYGLSRVQMVAPPGSFISPSYMLIPPAEVKGSVARCWSGRSPRQARTG
jgi:hypothetical protein